MSVESFVKFAEGFVRLRLQDGHIFFPLPEIERAFNHTDKDTLGGKYAIVPTSVSPDTLAYIAGEDPEQHYHALVRMCTGRRSLQFDSTHHEEGIRLPVPPLRSVEDFVQDVKQSANAMYAYYGRLKEDGYPPSSLTNLTLYSIL